jgi:DNA-binding transcriptional LysR family regulator
LQTYAFSSMASHAANQSSAVALAQQLAWDDLRIFLNLAQSGSTRQAAQRLGVNASTVSRKIAQLEKTLGARLLERHPDGFRLTAVGRDVVDSALQMNEFVRHMALRVGGSDSQLAGTVRLSCPEVLAASVAAVVKPVLDEHRALQIEFRVDDRFADLSRHEVDVAVRVSDSPPEDLVGRKLGRAGVGIYGSEKYWASHPYELDDERHRWIEWPAYVQRKGAYQWLEQRVAVRRVAVHASSSSGVMAAVAAGLGLAPLTHVHARQFPSVMSRWSLPEACGTQVWALTHREVQRNARVRVVLSALAHVEL